jgi:hypothetical protein
MALINARYASGKKILLGQLWAPDYVLTPCELDA